MAFQAQQVAQGRETPQHGRAQLFEQGIHRVAAVGGQRSPGRVAARQVDTRRERHQQQSGAQGRQQHQRLLQQRVAQEQGDLGEFGHARVPRPRPAHLAGGPPATPSRRLPSRTPTTPSSGAVNSSQRGPAAAFVPLAETTPAEARPCASMPMAAPHSARRPHALPGKPGQEHRTRAGQRQTESTCDRPDQIGQPVPGRGHDQQRLQQAGTQGQCQNQSLLQHVFLPPMTR